MVRQNLGTDWQRMKCLDIIIDSIDMDMHLSKLREILEERGARHAAVHGLQRVRHDLSTEQQEMVSA